MNKFSRIYPIFFFFKLNIQIISKNNHRDKQEYKVIIVTISVAVPVSRSSTVCSPWASPPLPAEDSFQEQSSSPTNV